MRNQHSMDRRYITLYRLDVKEYVVRAFRDFGGQINMNQYIVKDEWTGEVVIAGDAKECAKVLGISSKWFRRIARKGVHGREDEYSIEILGEQTADHGAWANEFRDRWKAMQKMFLKKKVMK